MNAISKSFDIAPFGLPNCARGEARFEEPRDILGVEAVFKGRVPAKAPLSYLRGTWPKERVEKYRATQSPAFFGWMPGDDQFNSQWQKAAAKARQSDHALKFTFENLSCEMPDCAADYDVPFRRTLGIKLDLPSSARLEAMRVHTTGIPAASLVRVELDAGQKTRGQKLNWDGYNAVCGKARSVSGLELPGQGVKLGKAGARIFELPVEHMRPAHGASHDEGMLRFILDHDAFTVSLEDLAREPVWCQEEGIFVTLASRPVAFAQYRRGIRGAKSILMQVRERPEQTYGGAFHSQPRPHAAAYTLGWKHARQRFWLEPNGDLVLHKGNVVSTGDSHADPSTWIKGRDSGRFLCQGNARFFFGLEGWNVLGRFPDTAPAPVYNIRLNKGPLVLEQASLALPLSSPVSSGETAGDATVAVLAKFTLANTNGSPLNVELEMAYSQDSRRGTGALDRFNQGQDSDLVPLGRRDTLELKGDGLYSRFRDQEVLRCVFSTSMRPVLREGKAVFRQALKPGQSCDLVLKVPFIALDRADELAALRALDFEASRARVVKFWRRENRRGAQLETPRAQLNALHASHLTHVQLTDFAMPGDPEMVNTSVGSSTYGNYSNEACMVVQELDQRGLHDEARRRLEVWLRYQGTAPQPGNFTDCHGMYFGAGGFESGAYNQHHGWVLWCLAEHYFLTRDQAWLGRVAGSMVEAADWVFRQRRATLKPLPHSRGWEKGFLPAGSLEDVTEFHYWLSTNALTWRGVHHAAEALKAEGHPEAGRLRAEAEAYRKDLIQGFETMRCHTPLVKLRDGRWVPHYSSRIYNRGRDQGWIREVLEGAVYLVLSGLYAPTSREANWILNDYHDNLFLKPPFGYPLADEERDFFSRGGFSIQPNLLAGLMPHLWRDEPELYIWMFFNSWCACYREEIQAMVEHPVPELGFNNSAGFKTSDQANAVMWLRYLMVYWDHGLLHFGRAMPRAWMADGADVSLKGVATYFGPMDARWVSNAANGSITLEADLNHAWNPPRVLARFRHPENKRIKSARVNGRPRRVLDPARGDVDITGFKGKVVVEARF